MLYKRFNPRNSPKVAEKYATYCARTRHPLLVGGEVRSCLRQLGPKELAAQDITVSGRNSPEPRLRCRRAAKPRTGRAIEPIVFLVMCGVSTFGCTASGARDCRINRNSRCRAAGLFLDKSGSQALLNGVNATASLCPTWNTPWSFIPRRPPVTFKPGLVCIFWRDSESECTAGVHEGIPGS